MGYCSKCGKEASDTDKFCSHCGMPISDNIIKATIKVEMINTNTDKAFKAIGSITSSVVKVIIGFARKIIVPVIILSVIIGIIAISNYMGRKNDCLQQAADQSKTYNGTLSTVSKHMKDVDTRASYSRAMGTPMSEEQTKDIPESVKKAGRDGRVNLITGKNSFAVYYPKREGKVGIYKTGLTLSEAKYYEKAIMVNANSEDDIKRISDYGFIYTYYPSCDF